MVSARHQLVIDTGCFGLKSARWIGDAHRPSPECILRWIVISRLSLERLLPDVQTVERIDLNI